MKKTFLSMIITAFFLTGLFPATTGSRELTVSRIYSFRVIAFHKKYELFCTLEPRGYYKYPAYVQEKKIYLTYEGEEFFKQCLFDESIYYYPGLYALALWTNNKGQMFRMKKAYGPVIDNDKEATGTDYGYAEDYK